MALTNYCTEDDIANRLSQEGVNLRVRDVPPNDLGDVLDETSVEIDLYLRNIYEPAQLALSDVVNHIAISIATCFLCEREGNPAPGSVAKKYDRALERLEKIASGVMRLPDATPRKGMAPVLSNVTVQNFPSPHTRVQRKRSTGAVSSYGQRRAMRDALEWLDYNI